MLRSATDDSFSLGMNTQQILAKRRGASIMNGVRKPVRARPAVAVALYRRRDEWNLRSETPIFARGTGGFNYTALAPLPDTILRAEEVAEFLVLRDAQRHQRFLGAEIGRPVVSHFL